MGSTNQTRLPADACASRDVFHALLPWQGMVKLYKGSIFVITETQFGISKSGYVTIKLHGTSTCGCNNNAIFSGSAILAFPAVVACRPRLSDRGKALAVHAKVETWQHC